MAATMDLAPEAKSKYFVYSRKMLEVMYNCLWMHG